MRKPVHLTAAGRPTRIVIQPMTKASVDCRREVVRSAGLIITVMTAVALVMAGVMVHRINEYRAYVAAESRK